jgi:hypothetical protein
MARIQLLLLALLASSFGVGARSVRSESGDSDVNGFGGKVQNDCESF